MILLLVAGQWRCKHRHAITITDVVDTTTDINIVDTSTTNIVGTTSAINIIDTHTINVVDTTTAGISMPWEGGGGHATT